MKHLSGCHSQTVNDNVSKVMDTHEDEVKIMETRIHAKKAEE